MYAIEFQTTIKNGVIKIPRAFLRNLTNRARVIVLVEETSKPTESFVDQLLAHPVPVKGFHPLTREQLHARQ
ncbi:MAG: hypothetical protein ACUVRU_04495 [Anaerolineae bacterium]